MCGAGELEAPPAPELGEAFDCFEDLGLIAVGGMADVRRVRDRRTGRVEAMKIIRADMVRRRNALTRFLAEARHGGLVDHAGVLRPNTVGRLPDGRWFFTMPLVEGATFKAVIQEVHVAAGEHWEVSANGWTPWRLVESFRRVCVIVGFAHARGVVHRDLKPENLMVAGAGDVRVMDWGLAVRAAPPGSLPPHGWGAGALDCVLGEVVGTPRYMSPEQARGEAVDVTSDVYSLGLVLYEILSGFPAFSGSSQALVLQARRPRPPIPLGELRPGPDGALLGPALPPGLVAITRRALACAPASRYGNAGRLAMAVGRWLDGPGRRLRAIDLRDEACRRAQPLWSLYARVADLRTRARAAEQEFASSAWSLHADADALEQQVQFHAVAARQLYDAAVELDPELAAGMRLPFVS